jgi:hypothetical protein
MTFLWAGLYISTWSLCNIRVILYRCEPKLNSPDKFQCRSTIQNLIESRWVVSGINLSGRQPGGGYSLVAGVRSMRSLPPPVPSHMWAWESPFRVEARFKEMNRNTALEKCTMSVQESLCASGWDMKTRHCVPHPRSFDHEGKKQRWKRRQEDQEKKEKKKKAKMIMLSWFTLL